MGVALRHVQFNRGRDASLANVVFVKGTGADRTTLGSSEGAIVCVITKSAILI